MGGLCPLMAFGAHSAAAQDIVIPSILELSGRGRGERHHVPNGAAMAVDEINAAGGILGKKIKLEFVDTASDPGKARAAVQRAMDDKPNVIFGPVFSGSVNVTMKLTAEAEVPQIIGGEAADITAQGTKYIFRTSFGQNVSMPKIANYIRDGVKAKTRGRRLGEQRLRQGRARRHREGDGGARHQGGGRHLDRGRPGRFRRRRHQGQGRQRRRVFVYLNEEESARFLREARSRASTSR